MGTEKKKEIQIKIQELRRELTELETTDYVTHTRTMEIYEELRSLKENGN